MSDIVERINELIPRDETSEVPLVWRARNVDTQVLIAARNEIARYRAGLQKIVEGDGFWDAPSLARDLLAGKDV